MKICIISHFAYGAMMGGASGHVGGVERQTTMLARWLARRDHEVTLLTWDEGQASELEIDGVLVMKICSRDAGWRGLRFLYPRWTSLNRAMRRANAEVYYQNCGDYVTGQVALWCRLHGRPFVYAVASDPDCDPTLPKLPNLRERLLYRYGVKHADRLVAQTVRQHDMLRSGFGLESRILPMPCPSPGASDAFSPAPMRHPLRVVWIGRYSRVKRLEVMLEVAALVPEMQFEVAGSPDGEDSYSRRLVTRAADLPNVSMRGVMQRHQMPDFYQGAVALLCTSEYEGFPNTFLEAWSVGVPVVSTVEPDSLLSRDGLGLTGRTPEKLAAALRQIAANPALRSEMSRKGREYYRLNHTVEASMPRFEKLLEEAAATYRQTRLAYS